MNKMFKDLKEGQTNYDVEEEIKARKEAGKKPFNWESEFDEKFTRISLDPSELGAYKDKWFLKDYITAGDLKQFYRSKLTELLESLKMMELKIDDWDKDPSNHDEINEAFEAGEAVGANQIIQEINKRIDKLLK
jgi:phosphoribosyl 1,2-cyclic phosphodiesterase